MTPLAAIRTWLGARASLVSAHALHTLSTVACSCLRLLDDPYSLRGRLLGLAIITLAALFWFRIVVP